MPISAVAAEALALRELIESRRDELDRLTAKYGATSPVFFRSVARGDARPGSDFDILVEVDRVDGNVLMRASGLMEETRELLGTEAVEIRPVWLVGDPKHARDSA